MSGDEQRAGPGVTARPGAAFRLESQSAMRLSSPRDTPADPSGEPASQPLPDGLVFAAALAGTHDFADLARVLAERLVDCGSPSVFLSVLDRNGVLRAAGRSDSRTAPVGDWSQPPLMCTLPLARMPAGELALWLAGEDDDRVLAWVSSGPSADELLGPNPVRKPGLGNEHLVCIVGIAWRAADTPAAELHRDCEQFAAQTGRRLRDLALLSGAPDSDLRAPWLGALLDAIPVPAALLLPVRDADGTMVEFILDRCNGWARDAAGNTADRLAGRLLLDVFPGLAGSGVIAAFEQTLESGSPYARDPFTYEEPVHGVLYPALLSLRAQRIGAGLVVSWQFHDEQARLSRQVEDAERLLRLAWAHWNLVTGEVEWSPGMYDILGVERGSAPLSLYELSSRVVDEDLPVVAQVAQTLFERRSAASFECRLKDRGGSQRVSVTAEPAFNTLGEPVALRCVVQDVTVRRGIEAALRAARLKAESQRRLMVEEMQRALLAECWPRLPGLRVAVRYRSAEDGEHVGGDWFEAAQLPDGRVLLCIGDASGHGLVAAARMAQLRNALLGIAHTGAGPARMLECLNLVSFQNQGETVTATAIAALFDPRDLSLTWARAGHPPPILIREGRAWELPSSGGMVLGVIPDPGFPQESVTLYPGDSLLLYTDGLLERHGVSDAERLDLLIATAAAGSGARPEEQVQWLFRTMDTDPEDDRCALVVRVEGAPDHG